MTERGASEVEKKVTGFPRSALSSAKTLYALATEPRVAAAILAGGGAAAAAWRWIAAVAARRALAEDLLAGAARILEAAAARGDGRVPAAHLRDALIRGRCPLAGADRDAAEAAWALVESELDSDARVRSLHVAVAGKRMKHYELIAAALSPGR